MDNFNSIIELISYFDTENKCLEYLEQKRWNGSIICPHCKNDKYYRFKDRKRFKCASCREQFTAKIGTIFEDSKISLKKWFVAIYLNTAHKKGVSSHQLAKDIKVTQKTAWFMLQRIRFGLGADNSLDETLEDTVEVDETFVGGKNKNRHADKKVKNSQGRSFKDKTPILGMMQRGGKVKTVVIPSTGREHVQPIVKKVVKPGTVLMTDEWWAYTGLNRIYDHYIVNHGAGEYVNGDIHTNNIEGFWPWIKRMISGVYHSTSKKHLQFYANEATFRYNTRTMTDGCRLDQALTLINGRIKYHTLIGK